MMSEVCSSGEWLGRNCASRLGQVASYPADAEDPLKLLSQADAAMYHAKSRAGAMCGSMRLR